MESCYRPGVRLPSKRGVLKAEVSKALLYGCVSWSLNKADYDRLRKGQPLHASPMPRLAETEPRRQHTLSCPGVLVKADSKSIEGMVRKRRILFAIFVARVGEKRLPRSVTFGEKVGGGGHSGRQQEDWTRAPRRRPEVVRHKA